MNILILGAAGQISDFLRQNLLDETDHKLILFARDAENRIPITDSDRETLIDGDFENKDDLNKAMSEVDLVYLDEAVNPEHVQNIVDIMNENNIDRIIVASALGIYGELPEKFGKWNNEQIGSILPQAKESADVIENSPLRYTIMRMAWLYNEEGSEDYELTEKGETFKGTQVTRQAIARFVINMLTDLEKYKNRNIGVSEPDTEGFKPQFYDDY